MGITEPAPPDDENLFDPPANVVRTPEECQRAFQAFLAEHPSNFSPDQESAYAEMLTQYGEYLGLPVDPAALPRIICWSQYSSLPNGYILDVNAIGFHPEKARNGETVGEEYGHYLREQAAPGGREHLTHEFFGFLSRRLFYRFLQTGDREPLRKLLFATDAEPVLGDDDLKSTMARIHGYRADLEHMYETMVLRGERRDGDAEQVAETRRVYASELQHHRGYRFASQVDLDRIHDWPALFRLPEQEVRKRFFTDEPDYSGL